MLTEQEKTDIQELFHHVPTKQSASIEALKVVQKYRGYVSDEALRDTAEMLGMSPADLDGVATFYNLIYREPVGQHVIHVCDSVSCWVMGEERVLDHLERKLGIRPGQTTPDGIFTLLPIVCLGHCEQAPAMMLDDQVIGDLTDEKLDQVLAEAAKRPRGA